mgnify:CR=1 FL=1
MKHDYLRNRRVIRLPCNNVPNIIRIQDLCQDEYNIYIISEIMPFNLTQILRKYTASRQSFSERNAANLIHQILLGLNCLHEDGIVHRDLKLENIMVEIPEQQGTAEDMICRITDFGFACSI